MKKSHVNIELAHIYVNEDATDEHLLAVEHTKRRIAKLVQQDATDVVTSILIDDYNPSDWTLDVNNFLNIIRKLGLEPDFVIYESKLTYYKERLLNDMDHSRLGRQYETYISKNHKCPCSFLIAVWYLVRLGIYDVDQVKEGSPLFRKDIPFSADKIYTVLPRRYMSVEEKGVEILKKTPYWPEIKDKIGYCFH